MAKTNFFQKGVTAILRFVKTLSLILACLLAVQSALPVAFAAEEQIMEPQAEPVALAAQETVLPAAEEVPVPLAEEQIQLAEAAEETGSDEQGDPAEPAGTPEQTQPEEAAEEELPAELPDEEIPEDEISEEEMTDETQPAEEDELPIPEQIPEEPAEIITDHNVPCYFQDDYPDTMFGFGTVASSGCSITCLAMVATYLTGDTYLPDQMARYFGGRAANNMARLEYGADALQLPYTRNTNFHETLAALKEGKIAIALLGGNSAFTSTQHFVVLRGITEDGKILVNDPYLPNYGNQYLERGFVDGFAPGYISNGYEGGWVFDPNEIPEDLPFYFEDMPELPEPRYPDIHLTLAERQLLAKVIWVEARGESFEGQQAVAEVILNRMSDPGFPNTLAGVIYAQGQFRSVDFLDEAEPYQTQYEAIERALFGPYVLPKDVLYFATFYTNDNVWGKIGGHIFCYRA